MSVAESFVSVRPDLDGFGGELRRGLGGLTSIARAGGLMIGAALVGAGTAIVGIGREFEDAFNTIRVGTGATGDALEGLKDDFREVARTVPAEFGDVSTAIADLNTRLGLTGEPLQEVATQFLELSRITDTDLTGNIESITRVFGDWGTAVEDQAGSMDMLFRASQETGIGVDRLAQQMVQFGAPLRSMGFEFEEAAAMLASFEREGVNAELVMGSLRIALGNFAREGVTDTSEALQQIIEDIQGAGSAGEAAALAIEVFGARAGPDMAAAIREGRLSVEDLVAVIEGGEETILGAAEDTRTLTESWQNFKNNAMLALEPIATRVLGALSEGFERLAEWWQENGPAVEARVESFADAFSDNWPAIRELGESLMGLFSALGELIGAVFGDAAAAVGDSTDSQREDMNSLSEGINDLVGVLTFLSESTTRVTREVSGRWNFLAGGVVGDMDRMTAGAIHLDETWNGRLSNMAIAMGQFAVSVNNGINDIIGWFRALPDRIVAAVGSIGGILLNAGRQVIGGFLDGMRERWDAASSWLSSRAAEIRNMKGPIEYDRTILEDAGHAVIEGFGKGMADEWRQIERQLGTFTAEIPGNFGGIDMAGGRSNSVHVEQHFNGTGRDTQAEARHQARILALEVGR